MLRIKTRFGSGPPDPEDIAQIAFSRLLTNADWSSIKDPKSYLLRTANNLVISELRALSVRTRYAERQWTAHLTSKTSNGGSGPSLEDVFSDIKMLEKMANVVDSLPKRQRRIFEMQRFDDMTLTDIAKAEGISRTAVRNHLAKATATVDRVLNTLEK